MFPKYNTVSKKNKDFYISYNYSDRAAYGSDTTALVIGQMQRFYILNGDHRRAYSQFDTFEQCIEYFKANAHLMNKLSNQYEADDADQVIDEYKAFKEKKVMPKNLTTAYKNIDKAKRARAIKQLTDN